jgi:hypothetical protein
MRGELELRNGLWKSASRERLNSVSVSISNRALSPFS